MLKQKEIDTFKQILQIMEKRSTCLRLQVAALIIKEGRIISTGYNGTCAGQWECLDIFKDKQYHTDFLEKHHDFSDRNECHAEQNAIAMAAKEGIAVKDCIIITSIMPCCYCAKLIIASGIKEVYYVKEYDRNNFGKELLNKCKIEYIKI